MVEAVLHTLEFHKIIELLAQRTTSSLGRELAEALKPVSEVELVQERIDETQEARDIMAAVPNVPLGGIRDIRKVVKRAELGAVLDPSELLGIASILYAARRMKHFFHDLPVETPLLSHVAGEIEVLRPIENAIENTLTEQGQIRDDASVELKNIRREIRTAQSRVKEKLDQILRSAEYQKYFQDALVTIRSDRYVIPIKQEYRQFFPGIVHDQSASGATVFIEPMAVVNLNNDIKQWTVAEKNEVERILAALSLQISRAGEAITANCQALARLDFVFAKARLSFDMQAQRPEINQTGYVKLQRARHPLIPSEVVVPIDVELGGSFHTLLITGPNTGGKTVTLKTVGLFALMVQAGLFIPAASGSVIAIFNNIFADIGDEQSIEQSLSTFSAHMTHLVKILQQVSARDLVLIDEIGAGTDPEEGAALAMAILEHLLASGARTIATTHYSELKTFAYSREGMINGSVEFDVETLKPTYRLLVGVPGSSNAFAISQRLGLSGQLIRRAKELLEKEHADLETVLQGLEKEKIDYHKRNEEVARLEREIARLREELTREYDNLEEKKHKVLQKAQQEAALLIRQAKRESDEVIAELKAQFAVKTERDRQTAITKARGRLRTAGDRIEEVTESEADYPALSPDQVKAGTGVYVTTLRQQGTVLSVQGSELTVQLGLMKVNVPLAVCRLAAIAPAKKSHPGPSQTAGRRLDNSGAKAVSRQIDIRGTNVEEAELLLEKYLDDAIVAGLQEVLVIHGKGTGALRKGVRSYLKHHYHVKDISIGELNEGGDGATVVRLL